VSLTVENLSTINLDVLSSVLYGCLEATTRIRLKDRGKREDGDRGNQEEKRGNQKEQEQASQ